MKLLENCQKFRQQLVDKIVHKIDAEVLVSSSASHYQLIHKLSITYGDNVGTWMNICKKLGFLKQDVNLKQ